MKASDLSDEQIMLLEQLTYMEESMAAEVGVPSTYESIESLVGSFDEDAFKKLEEAEENYDGEIKGTEWAAIIRAIQADEELMELKITNISKEVHAMCFVHSDSPEDAVVVFRGTKGQTEWEDNATGLYDTDTSCQEKALEYIERIPYDNVTVTGHSKGGNKAQYVTIMSDKVNRCISMNGQGFSQEFLDKYYAEIEKKGHCIKNYYLEGDYVNILMFPVPDSEQICIKGEEDIEFLRNHASSAFYQYYQNENGEWMIVSENGKTILEIGTREASMSYFHDLTTFLLNVMSPEDREILGDYLGVLLGIALVPGSSKQINGVTYTSETIGDYLLTDKKALSILIAYVLKYIETYNLTDAEIESLLEVLGLKEVLMTALEDIASSPVKLKLTVATGTILAAFIQLLIHNLHDGEDDELLERFFASLGPDFEEVWTQTEDAYQSIPDFDKETARNNGTCKTTRVRDFSQNMYDYIVNTIYDIEAHTYESVSAWSKYADEEWYGSLFISNAISGINTYFNRVSEINLESKGRIEVIFEQAKSIDQKYGGQMKDTAGGLRAVSKKIFDIVYDLS